MTEFSYNNTKNASNSHMPFKLNCNYYPWMSYEKKINSRLKLKSADKWSIELRELMIVYWKNFYHVQELQKQAYDKDIKTKSYVLNDKVWLNSKYIKIIKSRKLEEKFLRSFWVLYLVGEQAYKLELSKMWPIHDIFHMSLLKQITTRKGQMDKEVKQIKFDVNNNNSEEYKVEAIWKVRSMQESQNQIIYRLSTIWSYEEDIQRKRISGNQLQRFSISKNLLICSTRIILISRPQLLLLSILYHRWLD